MPHPAQVEEQQVISVDAICREVPGRKGATMTDVLIRGMPDGVAGALDAKARLLGISRTEYLRRQFARLATSHAGPVTADTLRDFAVTFADLDDPELLRSAWK
jgi:hypothetical protein